jgi:hypothetical protein
MTTTHTAVTLTNQHTCTARCSCLSATVAL